MLLFGVLHSEFTVAQFEGIPDSLKQAERIGARGVRRPVIGLELVRTHLPRCDAAHPYVASADPIT